MSEVTENTVNSDITKIEEQVEDNNKEDNKVEDNKVEDINEEDINEEDIKVDETVTITENLKPFRSSNYDKFDDKFDKLYAAHMKTMYNYVESDIKEEFNTFTENLIDEEEAISRFKLLDAIDNFKYKYKLLNDKCDYSNWMKFTDEAFNYRPHQPCIIS